MPLHQFFDFNQQFFHSLSLFIAFCISGWWLLETLSFSRSRHMPTWLAVFIIIGCYLVGNCMPFLFTAGYMADLWLKENPNFIEVFGFISPFFIVCAIIAYENWKRNKQQIKI